MMTRKDYVVLANALGDALADAQENRNRMVRGGREVDTGLTVEGYDGRVDGIKLAAQSIATYLAAHNENFRRDQFMQAIEYRARTGKLVKVGQTRFDR